jgi:hypothetical protein
VLVVYHLINLRVVSEDMLEIHLLSIQDQVFLPDLVEVAVEMIFRQGQTRIQVMVEMVVLVEVVVKIMALLGLQHNQVSQDQIYQLK